MIVFESVSKTYPGGTVAVENFSLTIPSRKTMVFVGSSGSGKTTLLKIINRLVEPTSGRVLIDDADVADLDPVKLRRSIGYVLQQGGLLPHRTVLDNIATVPILNGTKKPAAKALAYELMERVGLETSQAHRYPSQLSGGQQQRVGVARALATDPNILLMDEPFGAVDPIVRRELQDELLKLQADLGKTIVFITHDIQEAFRIGDEVVLLETPGKIVQQGKPETIMANPATDFVEQFIGANFTEQSLQVKEVNGRRVVFDQDERPLGTLS